MSDTIPLGRVCLWCGRFLPEWPIRGNVLCMCGVRYSIEFAAGTPAHLWDTWAARDGWTVEKDDDALKISRRSTDR